MKSNLIDIACEIRDNDPVRATIAVADGTMEEVVYSRIGTIKREKWFWLPRSLTEINSDGTVTIPEWLAIEKGLV